MNPLGNGNIGGLTPEMLQGVNQVKNIMQMAGGNPMMLAQQNPMFAQVMQMCKGQNPEQMFYMMCKQKGINPELILREFRK